MASVSDFRNGMAIRYRGAVWLVSEFQHVKPGKGQAFIRTKLKQLITGKVVENSFRLSEKIEEVRLEGKEMQYLYSTGDACCFMNNETYEQIEIPKETLGDQVKYLKEGNTASILFMEGTVMTVSLPMFVELEITEAAPGVKGDTVSNLQKLITLETGAIIQGPLFLKAGDVIKIDTRTGKYIERINK